MFAARRGQFEQLKKYKPDGKLIQLQGGKKAQPVVGWVFFLSIGNGTVNVWDNPSHR